MKTRYSWLVQVGLVTVGMLASLGLVWGFSDDFNDGDEEGWTVVKNPGEWKVDAGEYFHDAMGGPAFSVTGEAGWTDYTVTCRALGVSPDADWGLILRQQDADNYYIWIFVNDLLAFRECVAGSRTHLWTEPFATVLDEWQEFKVVATGDTFECYFDGELKTTVTSDRFKSGSVGVFAWDQARFDDFEVTGPGISHGVEKDGKLAFTWGMIKAAL